MNVRPILPTLLVLGLSIMAEPAFAGPGGIIKAAAQNPIARIAMIAVGILMAPLIIWYTVKYFKQVNKTRKDLQLLATDLPQYRWLDLRDRAEEICSWVWSAWEDEKMQKAAAFTTTWYWQNQQLQLDRWAKDGLVNKCRLIAVKDVTPLFVEHVQPDGDGSRVVVKIEMQVIDYLMESATQNIVKGDTKEGSVESIWTMMWRDGCWRLNKIEPDTEEWTYINMPNVIPAALAQAPSTGQLPQKN